MNLSNRTPFSDMVAEQAMQTLYHALPGAVKNGESRALRAQVAWGSLLAGVAIANAGTTVAHALAQPLGAHTHLSHGLTVAIFTLPVLRHTWQAEVGRFARVALLLEPGQVAELQPKEQAERAVTMVASLLTRVGMNRKMRKYGVPDGIVDLLISDVFSYMSRPLSQHPKHFSEDEVRQIIHEAL